MVEWVSFNTSPDILEQIHNSPFYIQHKRETKNKGYFFIDAQIDHTTGLLMLLSKVAPSSFYIALKKRFMRS